MLSTDIHGGTKSITCPTPVGPDYAVALEKIPNRNIVIHQINPLTGNTTTDNVPIAADYCLPGPPKPLYPMQHGSGVAVSSSGQLYLSADEQSGASRPIEAIYRASIYKVTPRNPYYYAANIPSLIAYNTLNDNVNTPFLYDAYVPTSNANGIQDIEAYSTFEYEESGVRFVFNDIFAVLDNGKIYGYKSDRKYTECPDKTNLDYQQAQHLAAFPDTPSGSQYIYKLTIVDYFLYVTREDGKIVRFTISSGTYLAQQPLTHDTGYLEDITDITGTCNGLGVFSAIMPLGADASTIPEMVINHTVCSYLSVRIEEWAEVDVTDDGYTGIGSSDIELMIDMGFSKF
jgi:hypothetical protein